MDGKICLLISTVLLANGALAFMDQPRSYQIDPPSDSVITAFKYEQHIEIECRISQEGQVRNTLWTAHTAEDLAREEASGSGSGSNDGLYGNPLIGSDESSRDGLPPEIVIDPVIDPRFSIEGEGGSLLIIDLFAPELNGTIIYCRDEDEGDLVAFFRLRSTPIVVVTDPEPGPIFAEEFSNITILCDIQHENIDQQHWIVQGQLLPDEGYGPFVISGPHQNTLTVVNFTGGLLEGTFIGCQIAFHGNIPIAQFSIHQRREYPVLVPGVEYRDQEGECDSSNTLKTRQKLIGAARKEIGLFAAQKKQQEYYIAPL